MRINKKLQYGLLLTLYICRAGRATVEGAAEGLKVSYPFLAQIAGQLRKGGVLKSIRGEHGGYEIVGEPKVQDVFNALSPVSLLSKQEANAYAKGPAEHRALAQFAGSLGLAISPFLRRKVRAVGSDLVANEMGRLNRLPLSAPSN